MNPTVSIIIPLYNKAPFVEKCLQTVVSQSFSDWECIIVNDGSTDNSTEVVESWLKEYINDNSRTMNGNSCFKLISQPNAGVSAARNRGIAEAKGKYIAFLDADDWWAPTFLEEMMHLVDTYPDAGLYAGNYIYYKPGKIHVGVARAVDVNGEIHDTEGWSGYINYPKSYFMNGGQVVWTGAVMIDRSKIEDCRLENGDYFPRQVQLGEDFLLWVRMAMKYKVAIMGKPLAYYNNDVPATLRLTCNLHAPAAHMLWQLTDVQCTMHDAQFSIHDAQCNMPSMEDWKRLFDKLRVMGLLPYWMDRQYHDMAAAELSKVDWNALSVWPQAAHYRQQYAQPIWWLRMRHQTLAFLSLCKQQIKVLLSHR